MADKKISEFPTFHGEQGPKTYYIISSGDPGEADSANYRMPFSDLTNDILLSDADLISGKTGAFDLTTGISGSFTDKLLISGVEVLTGFSLPGGGDVIDADEENVNFGATEEEDARAVNFQQGGETKLELSEDGEVVVKGEVFTTEATTASIFEGPVTNNSFTNLLGTTNLVGATNLGGATTISGPTQVVSPTFDIGEDVVTTISGSTFLEGATTIKNSLTVAAGKATTLGGTLDVAANQATTLGGSLTVATEQATTLGGSLTVADGQATTLGGSLTVADGQATTLGGTLDVAVGKATTLGGTLTVADGQTTTLGGDTTVKGNLTSESLILQKEGGFTSTLTTGEGATSHLEYLLPTEDGSLALLSNITWDRVGPNYDTPEVDKFLKVSDDGLGGSPFLEWGIINEGEVNVQADWSVTSTTSDAFIKNKPTSLPPASHSLSSHNDVSDTAPDAGQVLKWNATDSKWTPAADDSGITSVSWDGILSKPSTFAPSAHSLSSHNDVSDTAPDAGQVLKWNATDSKWTPAADDAGTTISSLSDIEDVTITNAAVGDTLVLVENGTSKLWVNSQPDEPSLFVSDASLKENVSQISSAIEKIQSVRGVNFTWNDQAPKDLRGSQDIGVIAQEVQAIAPSAVSEKDGLLHVQYHKIIPLLIQSIHELSNENESLKLRISKLES